LLEGSFFDERVNTLDGYGFIRVYISDRRAEVGSVIGNSFDFHSLNFHELLTNRRSAKLIFKKDDFKVSGFQSFRGVETLKL